MGSRDSILGAFLGLVLGALLGAAVFAMTGSLDLGLAAKYMAVCSLAGCVFGWLATPSLVKIYGNIRERFAYNRPLTVIYRRFTEDEIRSLSLSSTRKTYGVNNRRFLTFFGLYALIGTVIAYISFDSGGVLIYFVLIFFSLALVYLGKLLFNLGSNVELTTGGITVHQGSRRHWLQWADIEKIWEREIVFQGESLTIWYQHQLKIRTKYGTVIKLDNIFREFKELASIIQKAATKHLLPEAINALRQGRSVDFDVFKVNSQGILHKEKLLPWADVERILIQGERVQVRRTGRHWFNWADRKVEQVANFPLFVIVVSWFARVEGAYQAPDNMPRL